MAKFDGRRSVTPCSPKHPGRRASSKLAFGKFEPFKVLSIGLAANICGSWQPPQSKTTRAIHDSLRRGGPTARRSLFSGGFRRFELLSHVLGPRLGLQLWDLMASHIIIETYFDEHEMEEVLCVFQYVNDLQSGASKGLVCDPDHSLLQVGDLQLLRPVETSGSATGSVTPCFRRATVLPTPRIFNYWMALPWLPCRHRSTHSFPLLRKFSRAPKRLPSHVARRPRPLTLCFARHCSSNPFITEEGNPILQIIVTGKASENFPMPMMVQRSMSPGSGLNT